eukprot:2644369-Rhodomonas_salina.3
MPRLSRARFPLAASPEKRETAGRAGKNTFRSGETAYTAYLHVHIFTVHSAKTVSSPYKVLNYKFPSVNISVPFWYKLLYQVRKFAKVSPQNGSFERSP